MIGGQINKNTLNLVYQCLENGHSIGNHSYTHPAFSKIRLSKAREEIEKTHEIIEKVHQHIGIKNPLLFRFPYGDPGGRFKNEIASLLKENDYRTFFWDVDTEDWKYYSQNRKKSLDYIMENCIVKKNRSVVLSHDLGITAHHITPYLVNNENYILKSL